MKIKCHQMLKGHNKSQGYSAPMIESHNSSKVGALKSFSFPFSDERRNLPEGDTKNYVLEIEPVNGNFDCTAAICTQYTDVGTPTIYSNWLVPEDGKTQTALQILDRKNFLRGQDVVDIYENGKSLEMKEVDIQEGQTYPSWQMTDGQENLLGQFLALYWMGLVQNQPSLGKPRNRLWLVLHEPGASELMTNEKAVDFFHREIVSRLPLEAQSMVSAVFGVKNMDAEKSFRKAVCVILSQETGVPTDKKIDLFKGTQDILRRIPSREDHDALKAIASCLSAGEQSYPSWYLKLRKLKNGIPKTTAPLLMYFCYVLQSLETGSYNPPNLLMYFEQCYRNIYMKLIEGGVAESEVNELLEPLAVEVSNKWCEQPHLYMDFYREKRNWLINEVKIAQEKINQYTDGLAQKVFRNVEENQKISLDEKLASATELLILYQNESFGIQAQVESFLSCNFEDWLFTSLWEDTADLPNESSFTRIISNWNSGGLKRNPDDVKEKLLSVFEQYKGISTSVRDSALLAVDKLRLKAALKKCKKSDQCGEQVSVTDLETLAKQIASVGSDPSSEDVIKPALEFIRKNLSVWMLDKLLYVQGDTHFLGIVQEWLTHDIRTFDDYQSAELEKIEKNVGKTLSNYSMNAEEIDHLLVGLRRKIGKKQIQEVEENSNFSNIEKALKIASIHRSFRRINGALEENDELSQCLNEAISDCFLDWNKAEKPFASSEELRYDDNWFVSVAKNWLSEHLKDYILDFSADDLQTLELNIKTVLDAYRISEEQKNQMLQQIRIAKSEAQLDDTIHDDTISKPLKALKIAGIHNSLRKTAGLLEIATSLVLKLQEAMITLFYDWSFSEEPFASNEGLRYEDNWFLDLAQLWLNNELEQISLEAEQLNELEKNIIEVATIYKMPKDNQNNLLVSLRRAWAAAKLDEQYDISSDDPSKAICIADIHNRIRQYPGTLNASEELCQRLLEEMQNCFLAWEHAEKPFISGSAGRYEDDWFVEVANHWLNDNLANTNLNAMQLEQMETHLTGVFSIYHRSREQQNKDLLPLRAAWCRAKLEDVRQNDGNKTTENALCIAGIHTKLIRQIGIEAANDPELGSDLQSELRNYFIAWSNADKPFASGTDLKYEDGAFFEAVTSDWLNYDMPNSGLDSEQMETLESKLKPVFGIYKIFHDKQNELLLDLRKAWGSAKIRDIQLSSKDRSQQALCIAGIHNKLRQIHGILTPGDDLSQELETAMIELFLDWSKAEKPFASSEQLRYEDDWFVQIASRWLQDDSYTATMNEEEISNLEENFVKVFNAYKEPKDSQNALLRTLRINKCTAQLSIAQQNLNADNPDYAILIASIHNEYRKIITMQDGANPSETNPSVEHEMQTTLQECFVAWSQTEKPFVSGQDLKYNDDIFVSIAKDWLSCDLSDSKLSSEQLNELEGKMKTACIAYKVSRDEQKRMFLPLKQKWGEVKLQEILSDSTLSSEEKALYIADIHNKLRQIENAMNPGSELEVQLQNIILDYFVEWSKAEKPFASGLDLRYDDSWYQTILKRWCRERMPSIDLEAAAFSVLAQNIENAAKSYRLSDWESVRKEICEKNAEIYINEESGLTSSSEETICKIAEMLFRGDVDPQNDELYQKAVAYVSNNFDRWAMTQPSFRMPNGNITAYQMTGKEIFVEIIQKWNEKIRLHGDISMEKAKQLCDNIQNTCIACHIPAKNYEKELQSLDIIACWTTFENIQGREVTPEAIISLANIRKKLESFHDSSSTELMKSICDVDFDKFAEQVKNVLLDRFEDVISSDLLTKDEGFISVTEDWLRERLTQYSFECLDEIRSFEEKIEQKYLSLSATVDQMRNLKTAFEIRWQDDAIKAREGISVSISEIAASVARLKSIGSQINEQVDARLDNFLLEKFDLWADDGFHSECENNLYTYEPFPKLAKKWLNQANYSEYNLKKLETLSEKLFRALTDGYGIPYEEAKNLIVPITKAQNAALIKQSEVHPTEDVINVLQDLYTKEPMQYGNRIFNIYLALAKQGSFSAQIAAFIDLQKEIWGQNNTPELQKSIVYFLNDMCDACESNRPDELQDTMHHILEQEHYQLDADDREITHWIQLKNHYLEQEVDSFLKRSDDPESFETDWNKKNRECFKIEWLEVAKYPFFKKSLTGWYDRKWQDLGQNADHQMKFISGLTELTSEITDQNYRDILMQILFGYVEQSYQALSNANPQWQDSLNNTLQVIQSCRIDIRSILQSPTYISGDYRKKYEQLLRNWDIQLATSMLQKKMTFPGNFQTQLALPKFPKSQENVQWLYLTLLHDAPFAAEGKYWDRILSALGTPKLEDLDKKELKEIGAHTSFMKDLQWCFQNIPGKGDSWLADELKRCLKTLAPNLWKEMHTGFSFLSGGIKKLVSNGWRGLPEDFANWLKN